LGCRKAEVESRLASVGERFERDSPLRRACDAQVQELLREYETLREHRSLLQEVVRRYARTPSFLVRFFPLQRQRFSEADMIEAMDRPDGSGFTLRRLLEDFFGFLQKRCGREERLAYLAALRKVQTGVSYARGRGADFSADELGEDPPDRLLPNVRLVNGATQAATRRRLMLTFNTPFYPEVLIASSVLAEGVDLHLNCRHVIHHDLCWNPSTLEQRTGRVDRIGAKVERCRKPVRVYMPYVAATQDEKMYRVVMDRERWFNVVMGEQFKVDVLNADRIAERVPLPESLARELMFELSVGGS
jgi:superfamily II DNA/RNA helicase